MNYADNINATGLNLVIKNIAAKLQELTWIDTIYGRAYDIKDDNGKVKPRTYFNQKDYLDVLPHDTTLSQCFFRAKGNETVNFDTNKESRRTETSKFERNLSLIFWVNLQFLEYSGNIDYIYTENLKLEVLKVLKSCNNVSKITAYYDEDAKKVFEGYDLEEGKRQFLMYPFDGFRIDFTVSYHEDC